MMVVGFCLPAEVNWRIARWTTTAPRRFWEGRLISVALVANRVMAFGNNWTARSLKRVPRFGLVDSEIQK